MIKKKFIGKGLDGVGARELQLENDMALNATTSSGTAEPILKLDASNVLQLLKLPRVSADASHASELVRKSQLDSAVAPISALSLDVDAVESRLVAEEVRALAAENVLDGKITTEKNRALGIEGGLRTDLTTLQTTVAGKLDSAAIGSTVAPLSGGKLPSQYLPALAITDVFVRATLAERDALVTAGTVQTGDIVKVTGNGKTYIYDGAAFVELSAAESVSSVNGQVGTVVLNSSHVAESGDFRYLTAARETSIKNAAFDLVSGEQAERMQAVSGLRSELLSSQGLLKTSLESADALIRTDFMAADAAIRTQILTGDENVIAGYQFANTQLRTELISADTAGLNLAKGYTDSEIAAKLTSKIGAASGIASLDSTGKILLTQLPGVSLTDVYVRATIAERDALNPLVQEGDICRVQSAEQNSQGAWLTRTYVRMVDNVTQAASWLEILTESDVLSVAGKIGNVTLDTGDVSEKIGGPVYFTEARAQSAAIVNSMAGTETLKAPSVSAAKAYVDSELDKLKTQELVYQEFTATSAIVASNQITLSAAPKAMPLIMRQHILGRPGVDFSVSGMTVTFLGEWAAPSGESKLQVGDQISVYYMKEVTPFI